MALTRQQRRKRQAELAKRGQAIVRGGLASRHTGDDVVALGLLLRARLADTRNASRASQAASEAAAVFERSVAAAAAQASTQVPLACRLGCSSCCKRAFVSVLAPEAFWIAQRLRAAIDPLTPANAAARRLAKLDPLADWSQKGPCPLLDGDLCSIYDTRPLACRHLASTSLAACLEAYEGRDVEIPVPPSHALIGQGIKFALMAAVKAAGLDDGVYELRGAARLALAAPDAEARWLAGEKVLAGALPDSFRPPDVDRLLTAFAGSIRELAPG